MARKLPPSRDPAIVDQVLDLPDTTLVDVLDHVLNKGVMATGDVMLGVAGIDLVYLRLSALLCAADRVVPRASHAAAPRRTRRRGPGHRKRP
jgi:Gas vesicle protein